MKFLLMAIPVCCFLFSTIESAELEAREEQVKIEEVLDEAHQVLIEQVMGDEATNVSGRLLMVPRSPCKRGKCWSVPTQRCRRCRRKIETLEEQGAARAITTGNLVEEVSDQELSE